jgi:hypothetical protein
MPTLNHHVPGFPRWPVEKTVALLEMWNKGVCAVVIARRLGISRHAVEAKLRRLRSARRRKYVVVPHALGRHAATRAKPIGPPCLSCGETFRQQHRFDRVCKRCEQDEAWTSGEGFEVAA